MYQNLYQYQRIPFGISPAPAIFQRTMDTILQGIKHVICYIDNIFITGATQEEHLMNLEEVVKQSQNMEFMLKGVNVLFFNSLLSI